MKIETVTQQQEAGYKEWSASESRLHLDFWSWYQMWCFENGLFYDRMSFQKDDEGE